jgi:uncharacterized protein (UPF0147 family)
MIAGFLRQQAVELVKCETVDLEVPAQLRRSCSKATWTLTSLKTEGSVRRSHRVLLAEDLSIRCST